MSTRGKKEAPLFNTGHVWVENLVVLLYQCLYQLFWDNVVVLKRAFLLFGGCISNGCDLHASANKPVPFWALYCWWAWRFPFGQLGSTGLWQPLCQLVKCGCRCVILVPNSAAKHIPCYSFISLLSSPYSCAILRHLINLVIVIYNVAILCHISWCGKVPLMFYCCTFGCLFRNERNQELL